VQESLSRLGADYIDIYCLHRDNPDVPLGEWVDVLDENRRAGRIRVFGGSNWSTQRIEQANEYARAKGIAGFGISSPNFSLARWNQPMWSGCVTASDADSRAWYTAHQLPVFAWSSQASGFFAGRLRPELKDSPDWYTRDAVRTWVNEDNLRRLDRARELAERKGVDAVQIAMAYVLTQPFPTFALIGPRSIEETRTSLLGLSVELTPEEVRWLEGE
jgi:aryl-alcohol dehydrogenase-like predicted oxidoreductase